MSWADNEKLNEWIERAYENGRREEQERIIKLLEANTQTMTSPLDNSVFRSLRLSPIELISLIKGETND